MKNVILPPSAIGILGGGQLGKMTAMAAARLGYKTVVFCPEKDSPASHVAHETMRDEYSDEDALKEFASKVKVVTLEFENVPTGALSFLSKRVPVRPGAHVLHVAQDRLLEKQLAHREGCKTVKYWPINGVGDFPANAPFPCILKTRRLGYDGKGQEVVNSRAEFETAWKRFGGVPCILEQKIEFICELSVIVARDRQGKCEAFRAVQNTHEDGILRRTVWPSPHIDPVVEFEAIKHAKALAQSMRVIGLLAVEFFLDKKRCVIFNEMAPRPHNSGHPTLDACNTSQFEQLIRAICGLPLGKTEPFRGYEMFNLLGSEVNLAMSHLQDPDTIVHVYGKEAVRAGRKMGHVTCLRSIITSPDRR